jgi:PAS domain S-box-containing protein
LTAILAGRGSGRALEAPLLLASLNAIFIGGVLLAVAWMAARSYQTSGSLTFLMMGCGALFRGVSNLIGSSVMAGSGNSNYKVTLYDPCCLLAGVCHVMSAYYLLGDLLGKHPPETRSRQVAVPYAGIVVFVCVVAALAVGGRLPVFIVPGGGSSLLRQFVLGGALCVFTFSGLVFVGIYSAMKTRFAYWYGLALLLVAAGFVSVLFLRTMWEPLRWVGRSAHYLSGVYFIFALLAGRREMDRESVGATATTRWGLWPYLEEKVKERTRALEKANEDLQKEIAERKLTEQALQDSEERYRQLFAAETDAILLLDRESLRFIDANPVALKLYGYSREEILLLKASDVSAEPEKTRRAIAEGQTFVPLRWHRKKDGAVFPVETFGSFFCLHGHDLQVAIIRDITERRRAEEDLRRSETKFRTLYDFTSDAIMLLDEKGFFDCNPAALAMFGCASREEICSKHPADVSPLMQPDGTDSLTLANQQIATAVEKGHHQFEWIHKRADTGEAFAADVLLSAMELDGKRVLQATIRDISKLKQAQAAVSKAQAMQRAIFDSTGDFIWAVDCQDFRLLTFNRAFYDYSLQQRGKRLLVGQRPEDLLPNADYIERWHGYYQRALASGPFTTEYLSSSGKVTLLLTFSLLKHDGAVFGISVFGKDITERKRAEETVSKAHAMQRAIFDSTDDFIWSVDSQDFRLLTFNRAMYDYFLQQRGIRLRVGQRPEDRLPDADYIERWRGYYQRALASGPFTTEYRTVSGKVTLLLTFSLLKHDGAVFGISVFGKDITERKREEEDLRVSHEQLRALAARVQAVREEESTRLAREIHDVLAQELTSLKVDVAVLTRLLDQSAAEVDRILVREKLRGMTVTTDTAIQLVQKIATELRPVVLDSFGLCAAIEWQVKEFQARTGIRCKARLPSKDPPLDRDGSTALFRILQESLTNVARHAAATAVEVLLQCQAGYAILTIQDNGRGIQASQANAPGAVGLLGLRERALLLGGRCDISGRPGEGTRVEARLPLPPKVDAEEKQS